MLACPKTRYGPSDILKLLGAGNNVVGARTCSLPVAGSRTCREDSLSAPFQRFTGHGGVLYDCDSPNGTSRT
jgi:hypothetical protein